jgi:hypothetical protein
MGNIIELTALRNILESAKMELIKAEKINNCVDVKYLNNWILATKDWEEEAIS